MILLIIPYIFLGIITAIVMSATLGLEATYDADVLAALVGVVFWPLAWVYAILWGLGAFIIWCGHKLGS